MNLTDIYGVDIGRKRRKRVGRGVGSGHGKTSTRGHKGQKSRTGYSQRPTFEGGQTPFFRRLPKRGFSNVNFARKHTIINVGDLDRLEGLTEISEQTLLERRVIRKVSPNGLKVLGGGELKRTLMVKARAFSAKAVEKIEAAGGKAVRVEVEKSKVISDK